MNTRVVGIATVAALVLSVGADARAATIQVTATADVLSPTDGTCTLREALVAADTSVPSGGAAGECPGGGVNGVDLVSVPAGTYVLAIAPAPTDPLLTGALKLRGGVTLAGAGARTTTIDGASLDRVLDVAGSQNTVQGVSVRGGRPAPGETSEGGDGGGIRVGPFASLVLEDSAVVANVAGRGGNGPDGGDGGVSDPPDPGQPGASGGDGGGLYVDTNGSATVRRAFIGGNTAGAGGTGGSGGDGVDPDCMVVPQPGAGANGGTGGAGGAGGGIAGRGPIVLENVTVTGNAAGLPGTGGAGGDGGSSSIVSCDPVPPVGARGASGSPGPAGDGAGVHVGRGSLTLTASTFAANGAGGALALAPVTNDPVVATVRGSVLSGACATFTELASATIVDGGGNVRDAASCPGTTGTLALGAAAANGGPVDTLALGDASAALDAVPSGSAGCPSTDARGVPRPQGGACDAGAYERTVTPPTPPPPPGPVDPAPGPGLGLGRGPAGPVIVSGRGPAPARIGTGPVRVVRGPRGRLVLDLGFRVACGRGGAPCTVAYSGEASAGDDRLNLARQRLSVAAGRVRSARFTLSRIAERKLRRARRGVKVDLTIEITTLGVALGREVTVTLRAPR